MKRKRRRLPPQLRRYQFKRGHRAAPVKRRRRAATRVRKVPRRAVRRRNPLQAPAIRHFIFARRGGGKALHYDGVKFTSNGKPAYFPYRAQAQTIARELIRKFPVLRTYDVYVSDTSTKH